MKKQILPEIKLYQKFHRNSDCIFLQFSYNDQLIQIVKSNLFAKWSQREKAWYMERNSNNLKRLFSRSLA